MKTLTVFLVSILLVSIGLFAQPQSAIIGTWDCQFTWEGQTALTATFIFKSDGTFVLQEAYQGHMEGKWKDFGNGKVMWMFNTFCGTYTGTINPEGNRMTGTMTGEINGELDVGTWVCVKKTGDGF
jgi:hypothetical protein